MNDIFHHRTNRSTRADWHMLAGVVAVLGGFALLAWLW